MWVYLQTLTPSFRCLVHLLMKNTTDLCVKLWLLITFNVSFLSVFIDFLKIDVNSITKNCSRPSQFHINTHLKTTSSKIFVYTKIPYKWKVTVEVNKKQKKNQKSNKRLQCICCVVSCEIVKLIIIPAKINLWIIKV